jgi:hypothetical protein
MADRPLEALSALSRQAVSPLKLRKELFKQRELTSRFRVTQIETNQAKQSTTTHPKWPRLGLESTQQFCRLLDGGIKGSSRLAVVRPSLSNFLYSRVQPKPNSPTPPLWDDGASLCGTGVPLRRHFFWPPDP